MMGMKAKRLIAVAAVLCLIFTALVACGGKTEQDKDGTSAVQSSEPGTKAPEITEPVPLSIFRMATDQDPEKDPILQELQKRTNTKISFVTAPWDQYVNKVNLMMSSGEEVDIILAENTANPWRQWASEGLLLELDKYVTREKYPFIDSASNSVSFSSYKVNGKRYVLPGTHHGNDWAFYYRQDWLEKLGLQVPKTLDEFYLVLKAFKENDPDGNGTADTVGIATGKLDSLLPIFRAYGSSFHAGNLGLEVKDGKVQTTLFSEGTREALKYCNKLYREGLLNPDLATSTDITNQWIYTGKAGAIWTPAGNARPDKAALIPGGTAKLASLSPMMQPGYDFWYEYGPSYWLVYAVTKYCKNPEKALEFIEYVNSQPGRELVICGVKGKHYTQLSEDGVFDRNKEGWSQDYDTSNGDFNSPFWVAFFSTVYGYIPCDKYDTFEEAYYNHEVIYRTVEEEQVGFSYKTGVSDASKWMTDRANPLTTLIIDVQEVNSIKTVISEMIETAFLKAVFAKSPEEVDNIWQQFLNDANKQGFDKFMQAYQDYYDKNIK